MKQFPLPKASLECLQDGFTKKKGNRSDDDGFNWPLKRIVRDGPEGRLLSKHDKQRSSISTNSNEQLQQDPLPCVFDAFHATFDAVFAPVDFSELLF